MATMMELGTRFVPEPAHARRVAHPEMEKLTLALIIIGIASILTICLSLLSG